MNTPRKPQHWDDVDRIAYVSPTLLTIVYELDCACPSLRGKPVIDGHQVILVKGRKRQISRLLCPTCGKLMKLKLEGTT